MEPEILEISFYPHQYPVKEKDDFMLTPMIDFGIKGESGVRIIIFYHCTLKWLVANHRHEDIIIGQAYLFTDFWDSDKLKEFLLSYFKKCSGDFSYDEIEQKLFKLDCGEFDEVPGRTEASYYTGTEYEPYKPSALTLIFSLEWGELFKRIFPSKKEEVVENKKEQNRGKLKAEFRSLSSTDEIDLERYMPDDQQNFCFKLRVIAGLPNDIREDYFDIKVCTPQWLMKKKSNQDFIIGRHHLIVFEFNFERIKNFIQTFVENQTGDNWEEIAIKIGCLGKWQYETDDVVSSI